MSKGMDEFITGDTIANAVRMIRAAQLTKRTVMIVEGESDRRFLEICMRGRLECYPVKGKDKVIKALEVLKRESALGWFFALMDADFDRLLGVTVSHDSAVMTDLHDLECELLSSPALEKVVREYCSEDKCFSALGVRDLVLAAVRIRQELLEQGSVLGAIRFVSRRDGLSVKFSGMSYEAILVPKTVKVDPVEAVRYLLSRGSHVTNEGSLMAEVKKVLDAGHEAWQLCQGHDLVNLFLLGMRRLWGRGNLRDGIVDSGLRLAYEEAFLGSREFGKFILRFLPPTCLAEDSAPGQRS